MISNTVYFIFNTFYFTKSLLKVSDLRAYRESFQGFTAKVDKKAEDSKKVMTEKEKEIFNDLKKIIETKINFENLSNNFQALFKGSALTLSITTLTISAVLAVLAALSIMTGTAPLVFALTILPGIVALTVLAAEYGLGLKISPAKTLSITYPLRIAYRQLMLSWYTYQQQKVERLSKIDHSRPATADDYTTKIKKHETRLKELEKEYASRAWKDLANYGRWQKEDTTAFSRGLAEILADTEYKNLTRETQKLLHQMRIDEQLLKPSEDESAENKNARIAKIELQIQSFALESSSSITKRALKNIPEKLPDIEPWINLEIPE